MSIELDNIKEEVHNIFLPSSEMDKSVLELIDKAYSLGWENGYDTAKTKFAEIFTKLNFFENEPRDSNS